MGKKIVLVTSGQPSLNPRMVKEADALANAGYEVTVIYSYWNDWGADFDKQLLAQKKWKALCVGGDPKNNKLTYFISRLISKLAKKARFDFLTNLAIARPAYFLIREAKKHKADLYIGHNLGALPAVVTASKLHNRPCGFDAEDFHRNEMSNDANHPDVQLKKRIEDKYLPLVNYFSVSSPKIADAYKCLYPQLTPIVLLNVFSTNNNIEYKKGPNGPLKLFWFSQMIGANRGLQDIIKALQLLNSDNFELHLLGNKPPESSGWVNQLVNSGININFHGPVPPDELTAFAAQFDVGLALEPAFSINNNLALSNKIFTYMQAGLAIIASNTAAQQHFLEKNTGIGRIYPIGDIEALAAVLQHYHLDRYQLTENQNAALKLAREQYNWETESKKFLAVIEETLFWSNTP